MCNYIMKILLVEYIEPFIYSEAHASRFTLAFPIRPPFVR